jgi:hypothetical protein
MQNFLADIRKQYQLAVVGGSDLNKIVEQLGGGSINKGIMYNFIKTNTNL